MKNKFVGLLLLSILSLSVYAQKKPVKANTTSSKSKTAQTAKLKAPTVAKQEEVKPPPTYAEIKQTNIMSACKRLITWPTFGYSFFLSDGAALIMRLDSIVYLPNADAGLTRLRIKDDKQHTLYRFDVKYDSASGKVSEIAVYGPKELNETQYDSEHKKYKVGLHSRFTYHYLADSLTQILQYIPPYNVPQYSWELKMTTDSFAITEYQYDNRRIFAKAWLDRSTMRVDSAYFSTYSSFTPYTPQLYGRNYHHYTNGLIDDILMYGETIYSTKNYHKIYDANGKTMQDQYTKVNAVGYSAKEHVWTLLKRNNIGVVQEKATYGFNTGPKDEVPTQLPATSIPTTETYLYNSQNTVHQKINFYEDKCITRKITTDYVLDEDGFVLEYINKTDLQTRCRY